jgi:3-oxoacyl-[acyl-carrier protein] reductase
LAVDVADGAAIAAASTALLAEFPLIDILVNNAGITRDGLLFRMSDADWNDVLTTNLTSCFHWSKHLARPMTRARWGRIVNITSVSGVIGNAGQANYAAAKAGMIGLTKSLAREFASRSVTVNAVAPGFIKTDMTTEFVNHPEASVKILEAVPLKRFGEASDIAAMTAYLASEEAGYITGQVFGVDGGMAM